MLAYPQHEDDRPVGWAILVGLVAGILVDVATFLVARYGPQADGWSFRGNGALSVPAELGPALLAGGWAALVCRYRGFRRWLALGVGAVLVGIVLMLLSVLPLVLFNNAGMGVSNALILVTFGWMVVAPLLAGFLRAPAQQTGRGQLAGHLIAGFVLPVTLVVGFFAAELVLPPGS